MALISNTNQTPNMVYSNMLKNALPEKVLIIDTEPESQENIEQNIFFIRQLSMKVYSFKELKVLEDISFNYSSEESLIQRVKDTRETFCTIRDYLQSYLVIGHGVNSDLMLLQRMFYAYTGKTIPFFNYLDTQRLFAQLFISKDERLETYKKLLNIEGLPSHTANADVEAIARIFTNVIKGTVSKIHYKYTMTSKDIDKLLKLNETPIPHGGLIETLLDYETRKTHNERRKLITYYLKPDVMYAILNRKEGVDGMSKREKAYLAEIRKLRQQVEVLQHDDDPLQEGYEIQRTSGNDQQILDQLQLIMTMLQKHLTKGTIEESTPQSKYLEVFKLYVETLKALEVEKSKNIQLELKLQAEEALKKQVEYQNASLGEVLRAKDAIISHYSELTKRIAEGIKLMKPKQNQGVQTQIHRETKVIPLAGHKKYLN